MGKLLNKLQRDLLKRHVGPFIFCFLTVMFLLLMQFLILHIDKLVGKGLPFGVIIELIATNLAYMVVLAAPMAVLVASLLAFGKFSELNELTAMRAAGVNPIKAINPVLVAGALLGIFLTWFSNDVLPDANQRARALFLDIRTMKPGFDLKPGEFYDGIEGYTFLVREIDNETDSLYNVTLFQNKGTRTKREEAVIKSKRGILESNDNAQTLTLYLFDGSILRYLRREQTGEDIIEETHFAKYRISFDLSEMAFSRSNPEQRTRNDRTMSSQAMLAVVDSLENEIADQREKTFTSDDNFSIPTELPGTNDKYEMRFDGRSAGIPDSVTMVESSYEVLNLLGNRREQIALANVALSDLRNYESSIKNLQTNVEWRQSRISKYLVEVHKKFSIPFACLVFILIGAPIGMFSRKGNLGYAALIATGFLTFYWISLIQGEKLADRLFITPFIGMWFSNILLGIVGIFLVIRLCTSFKFSHLWNRK